MACSKALWSERVCYQEGCVARGWVFRVGGEGSGSGWSWGVMDNFRQVEGGTMS